MPHGIVSHVGSCSAWDREPCGIGHAAWDREPCGIGHAATAHLTVGRDADTVKACGRAITRDAGSGQAESSSNPADALLVFCGFPRVARVTLDNPAHSH
jgi:hypothetical protein